MLNDFTYHLYTRFIFGHDAEKKVGAELKKLGAEKILLVYGGNSIKASGLYDCIVSQLKEEGFAYWELGGVQANPRVTLVRRGIQTVRENGIDFLLAVGGGSVIDTAKTIGVGAYYDGDIWELTAHPERKEKMLPVGVVLTYPAAGSESSTSAVLTNDELDPPVKVGINAPFERPVIAFENPELTFSLPPRLTACGIADMYIHIWERYFSTNSFGSMDYMAESLMRALTVLGPKLMKDPQNYELRSEIMWIGTIAHNDTVGLGRPQEWTTHGLGHELSALYDTTHGASLTIMGPSWMKYVYKENLERFARYAKEVFHIEKEDGEEAALAGIYATQKFFSSIGCPVCFRDENLPTDKLEYMARHVLDLRHREEMGTIMKLRYEDILKIYQNAVDGE